MNARTETNVFSIDRRYSALSPSELTARLQAEQGQRGDTRTVVLNGSRIRMEHDGKQWWNLSVEPA